MVDPFGILNIDKPAGCTSRDVVNRVQRLVRPAKAGHAGTLDPLATGVLVVCVGPATRLIEYVQRQPKSYEACFLLGRRSDTDDIEGDVEELDAAPVPTREQLESVLHRFLGVIEQRPPAFSAVKVRGRRAYKLARQGKDVQLKPRTVRIEKLVVCDYEYPRLQLAIVCGSGMYVRSLGRDIAEALDTKAVMGALRRTGVGEFTVDRAASIEELENRGVAPFLLSPGLAVADLPPLTLDEAEVAALKHGRALARHLEHSSPEAAAFDGTGRLVAILARDAEGRWRPHRNFASLA